MRRLTDIDLRQIRIFRAIVECQGLAGAELVLNLSQSRISEGLAALETRVGARLCRRGRSGFALTEAGTELYAASHDLFGAVDRFCAQVGDVGASFRRVFRLGTVDAVVGNPDLALPAALRRFVALCPSVTIDFAISDPEALEESLAVGGRDLVIMPSVNRKAEFDYTPLLHERQSLYCGRLHPLFARPDARIGPADLAAQAFVARGYLHHRDLKHMGHREPQATVEMMEAQLALILSGEFIGYLPAQHAEPWVARGELRVIQDARLGYDSAFYLVTQRGGAGNPLIRHFRAAILGSEPAERARRAPRAG
jgi:DNA-binding transcriptional LysR family regulator